MIAKNEKEIINKKVKNYWEKPTTVSIIDENLHKIEIDIASKYLMKSNYIVDIGCGEGRATIEYAKKVRKCVGIEQSNYLLKKAKSAVSKSGLNNIIIKSGNILKIKNIKNKFDVVITQRLLINLLSWEEQQECLNNIYNILKPGGKYIMIENTSDSFLAMNEMRNKVGLESIPQHWHNKFFDYDKLMAFMQGKFQLLKTHDLGLYYFLTRVYVPMFSSFVGYGAKAVKDPIYERSDRAARIIFEKFQDNIKIGDNRVFGPIQVLVFKRGKEYNKANVK